MPTKNNSKTVPSEHRKVAKSQKEYVKGIIHNYSLQKWTAQEIVDYLHNEKQIDIARSTVSKIRNRIEQQAEKWYLELKQSRYLYLAHFKERIDTIYKVQNHLWKIANDKENSVSDRRGALAEIHHTEKTLSALYDISRYITASQLGSNTIETNTTATGLHSLEKCWCPTNKPTIIHSKCRSCLTVWCATGNNQEWCPNPDCSSGIKGCHFKPYDEIYEWVQCTVCSQWFMTEKILAVHDCGEGIPDVE